jgi:hypothetical protein
MPRQLYHLRKVPLSFNRWLGELLKLSELCGVRHCPKWDSNYDSSATKLVAIHYADCTRLVAIYITELLISPCRF